MRQVTRPASCGASPALAPQTGQLRTCSPCPGPFLRPPARACTRSPLQSTSQLLLRQLRVARAPPDGAPPSQQSMPAEGAEADAAAKGTAGQLCLPCLRRVCAAADRNERAFAQSRKVRSTTETHAPSTHERHAYSAKTGHNSCNTRALRTTPKTLPPCMPFPKHASTAQSSRSTPHTARQTVSTRKEGPRHGKVNNTRSKSHARGHEP